MAQNGFSLVSGGPFDRLAKRSFHRERHQTRLGLALAGITWVPMVAFALIEWKIHGRGLELLRDLSVHARLLVAIPLLLVSERILDERTNRAIVRFRIDGLTHRPGALDSAVRRSAALRDSWIAEALMLAAGLATGFAALGSWVRPGGVAGGLSRISWSAAWTWYALVGLPVFAFLLYRSLWHWLIWCLFLWRLLRADVQPLGMHPDGSGGLSFLDEPTMGFAPLGLAINIVICAAWITQIWLGTANARMFRDSMIALVAVEIVFAYGPLCVFALVLFRTKLKWLFDHGHLGAVTTRTFNERWVVRQQAGSLLDANAPCALVDYTTVFGGLMRMRLVPFPRLSVLRLAVILALPALPVALTSVPMVEIAKKLLKLVGGAAG